MTSSSRVRRVLRVRGVVQGVGFRPFVHTLATTLGLAGWVCNDDEGVLIEVEGASEVVDEFGLRLRRLSPPMAHITSVEAASGTCTGDIEFSIVRSVAGGSTAHGAIASLPPDLAVCSDCLREMFDPRDRRYRHPFITCTNCGPRFTIALGLPYDRARTTMAAFEMCAACALEYHDPADRRFHAQPLACHECGPRLELIDRGGERLHTGEGALRATQRLLVDGAIVAVKGIGGYHLMCDATNPLAVATLRARKRRGGKPLAVMVAGLEVLAGVTVPSAAEVAALLGPQRPILLLRRDGRGSLQPAWPISVAGDAADVGVMLPYAPVHHLLFDGLATRVLVCTSGNLADEPIVTDDDEAFERLGAIADAWLRHDRVIHRPCDDSVVRVVGHTAGPVVSRAVSDPDAADRTLVRRSRGWAPLPVELGNWHGEELPGVLAMGGDLKNVVAVASGRSAWLSQHLGDLGELATYRAVRRAAEQLLSLTRVSPTLVAIDAHPGYLSARLGREIAGDLGVPVVAVQHHHAHIVSVLAEAGRAATSANHDPVIGFAFDGTGFGPDGTIWGGEVLVADAAHAERVAHLAAVPLPGGDAAIEQPARAALAHLWAAGCAWDQRLPCVSWFAEPERAVVRVQLERRLATVPTSSMGRLFDAVAALAGVRQVVEFEAQAAIELEAVADPDADGSYGFAFADRDGSIDAGPVIREVVRDVLAGEPAGVVSTRFHRAVTAMVLDTARRARRARRLHTSVLTGGVFQNVLLMQGCAASLEADGFEVLRNRLVPTNDGGLALGQAVVAGTVFAHLPAMRKD